MGFSSGRSLELLRASSVGLCLGRAGHYCIGVVERRACCSVGHLPHQLADRLVGAFACNAGASPVHFDCEVLGLTLRALSLACASRAWSRRA